VRRQVDAERQRLLREAGLDSRHEHFKRPVERAFAKRERGHVTVLFGGLTVRHDRLVEASLSALGHRIARIPVPRKLDFQTGKEFGNNGQCNPTYFTVGALVNYLRDLRDNEGLSTEEILRDYVFITAGACGPCRFGMYEAEYRLALRNSGFDGFRVLLFQQTGGLNQAAEDAGFEFNLDFMLALLNSVFLGDLLNEMAYHIRPYEVEPGRTNTVFERALERLQDKLRNAKTRDDKGGVIAKVLSKLTPADDDAMAQKLIDALWGDYYVAECRRIVKMIDEEIEVDYTRPKPIVKITGEFWAQTTEGDGNFNMFPFLEREGAEVLVEPVTTWIGYLLHQTLCKIDDSRGLKEGQATPSKWNVAERLRREREYQSTRLKLQLGNRLLQREYERLRMALGGTAHELACQKHLERVGHPYYNSRSGGGEGHLEVAKNIYYSSKKYAHMVLSLKPFGCMPSTQSDGAQAAVVSHFSDIIYIPIETSGEGDVNAHSRVQMALGEAKVKGRSEFKDEVASSGYRLEQIRDYVARHCELRKPIRAMQLVPHYDDLVGRAAAFVRYVGSRMREEGVPVERTEEVGTCTN
jgi:predicted nucleotide-binding protein (sugar kinase/HSP70/actin superfamily)